MGHPASDSGGKMRMCGPGEIILGTMLLVAPFVHSVRTYDSFALPKTAFLTGSILLAATGIGIQLVRGHSLWRRPVFPPGLVLLIAWAGASAVLSDSIQAAPFKLLWLTTGGLLLAVAAFVPQRNMRLIVWVASSACAVESLLVVLQALGVDPLAAGVPELEGRWRIYGTLGNPNRAAWFLSTCTVMMVAFLVTRHGVRERLMLVVLLVPALAALVLTQSRGSFIAATCTVVLLILLFMRRKQRRAAWTLGAALAVVASAVFAVAALFPARFLPHFTDVGPVRGRVVHWALGFELAGQNPIFGVGPDNFSEAFARHVRLIRESGQSLDPQVVAVDHAHNEYLEFAVELGLPGLLFFLVFVLILAKGAFHTSEENIAIIPFLAGFVHICLLSLYDFPLREPTTWAIFWVNAGVMTGLTGRTREIQLDLKPTLQIILIAVFGVVCATGIYFLSIRPVMADVHYLSSVKALDAGNMKEASAEAVLASGLAPYREDYRAHKRAVLLVSEPERKIEEMLRGSPQP